MKKEKNNHVPKKIFVLDTNVLMNDPKAILHFLRYGDVYLHPIVIEELDGLKGRKPGAQDASRIIEKITEGINGDDAITVFDEEGNELLGKFFLFAPKFHSEVKRKGFKQEINDNKIINLAYVLSRRKNIDVTLVTEDLNVRIKARSLHVTAEPAKYLSASKETLSYKGWSRVSAEDMQIFSQGKDFVSQELVEKLKPKINQYFVVSDHIFYKYDGEKFLLRKRVPGVFGIKPRNVEQAILMDALLDSDIQLLTISGIAGTGKTLMALAVGLQNTFKGVFEEIIVSRKEVGVGGGDHGFLPGGEREKIAPYMQPFVDNLKIIAKAQKGNDKKLEKMKEEGEPYPFSTFSILYLRGRTISFTFVIVDEAQNLSPHEVKTLITRAGEGTKIIIMGDIEQIDSKEKYLRRSMNGVSYVMENLQGKDLYAHIELKDVDRSRLAKLVTLLP